MKHIIRKNFWKKDENEIIKRKNKSSLNEDSSENDIEKIQKKNENNNLDFIRKLKKKSGMLI